MARLKLREVLLGRLVKPEEDHQPPVPLQRSAPPGSPKRLSLSTASATAFIPRPH